MTREQAIRKATEFVRENKLEVGPMEDVRYLDVAILDKQVRTCPADLIETLESVRKSFRNHWVVSFRVNDLPGQISCPSSRTICVFENGEASLVN